MANVEFVFVSDVPRVAPGGSFFVAVPVGVDEGSAVGQLLEVGFDGSKFSLKSNATTTVIESLAEGTIHDDDGTWHVTDDRLQLGETGETFRRVTVTDPADETTEYLTTLPAAGYAPIDVMEIYTLRTMIEIFFRENKQNTNIQDFHSTTINGVLFELFCTLIGWVLMELYRGRHPVRDGVSGALRTLRTDWNQPPGPAGHLRSVAGYG